MAHPRTFQKVSNTSSSPDPAAASSSWRQNCAPWTTARAREKSRSTGSRSCHSRDRLLPSSQHACGAHERYLHKDGVIYHVPWFDSHSAHPSQSGHHRRLFFGSIYEASKFDAATIVPETSPRHPPWKNRLIPLEIYAAQQRPGLGDQDHGKGHGRPRPRCPMYCLPHNIRPEARPWRCHLGRLPHSRARRRVLARVFVDRGLLALAIKTKVITP